MMVEDPRYPVGKFKKKDALARDERDAALAVLEAAPAKLRQAVQDLSDAQLDTPYRDGGWTVRQVVHHVPDSHLNAYMRIRLALTEQEPTVRPYEEALWAELPDAKSGPVEPSLALLEAVHQRLIRLLRSVDEKDFSRRFIHPEGWNGTVDTLVGMYAWHCRHHTAHVTELRDRMGW
jgi:hypothetical protein